MLLPGQNTTATRWFRIVALAGSVLLGAAAFGASTAFRGQPAASAPVQARTEATEARDVTREFFRTLNAGSYERTCGLLAAEYYRRKGIPNESRCVLGLRVGFMSSPHIFIRITGVSVEDDRAVVHAIANGAPGMVTLVRDQGRLKILAMDGG